MSLASIFSCPVVWQGDNAPSHCSKATDWKKANFPYPELGRPQQSDPRWTTASGRPWPQRFQQSVFRRRLLSKQPLPVHLLWSLRPMLLTRRSVRSRIAFNSVSMPKEAISRHVFFYRCCIPGASQKNRKSQSFSAAEHLSSRQAARQTALM